MFTTLTAWGSNYFGQLGDGTYGNRRTTPVEVRNLDGAELKTIAAGGSHNLALKDDGTVLVWSDNSSGQLGDGSNNNRPWPAQAEDANDPSGYLNGVNAIAAGADHSLALKDDGTVWAWGNNTSGQGLRISGQLGTDEIPSSNTPVEVGDLPGGVEAIAAGSAHGLALKDDGIVWAWGNNNSGQLGDGTNATSTRPVQVSNLDGVKAIDGGGGYSLALKNDGTVWAWGGNFFGQLGDGTTTNGTPTKCELMEVRPKMRSSCSDSNTPVQMGELPGGIEAIAAGGAHGLALKNDGTVWAWGNNQNGQLGNGTITLGTNVLGINAPMQVSALIGAKKAIAAGSEYSLAGG
jgi:alpha-tubulin suppressor-like RCC1 family protein